MRMLKTGTIRVRTRMGAALTMGTVLAVCGATLVACGGSAATPTTTTSTVPAPTTTLTVSQLATLQSLLLTTAEFPSGWIQDTATDAAGTKGTPSCVADLVLLKGSTVHASAVFAITGLNPSAVIQTVGQYSPGRAGASVKTLKSTFDSCNGGTLSSSKIKASIGIRTISVGSTGDSGFAAQMILTENKQSSYLDVLYAVKGANSTFLGWSTVTASTSWFTQLSTKAVGKL